MLTSAQQPQTLQQVPDAPELGHVPGDHKTGCQEAVCRDRQLLAERVSSHLRQVADFRRDGLAGQRLLSACSANVPSRPLPVIRSIYKSPRR